jgi:DnaK suppressor protein
MDHSMSSGIDSDGVRFRLSEMRRATLQRAATLTESFDDIVEAAGDVATDDEHDPEGHTIAWERQQVAALLGQTRSALASIEQAERRLDNGLYGICTACAAEIGDERLDALPATPTCATCARSVPSRWVQVGRYGSPVPGDPGTRRCSGTTGTAARGGDI